MKLDIIPALRNRSDGPRFAESLCRDGGSRFSRRSNLRSGIHPAINGKIRPGNVRGLRTGDERHRGGDLINMPVAVERGGGLLRHLSPFCSCSAFLSLRNLKLETTLGEEHHWAVLPPSTRYDAPVMNDALSDARNRMVWAISSGLPTRLSGTVAARAAFLSLVPVKPFSIPVSIGPGATMLTRTPEEAASRPADLVSPSTACLLAAYTDAPAAPVRP